MRALAISMTEGDALPLSLNVCSLCCWLYCSIVRLFTPILEKHIGMILRRFYLFLL